MAREVVTWCDPCLAEKGEHVAAHEYVLSLSGWPGAAKAPRSIDLCESCATERLVPVVTLLNDYGKTPHDAAAIPKKAKSSSPTSRPSRYSVSSKEDIGPLFCQVPGCGGYTNKHGYPTINRIRSHVRAIHPEVSWQEYLDTYGEPKTGERPDPQQGQQQLDLDDAEVFRCEHCEKTYSYADTLRPAQSLGVHRAKVHGIRSKRKDRVEAAAS